MDHTKRLESDRKYREAHREEIRQRSREWMESKRRAEGVLPRKWRVIKANRVELHKKVFQLKEGGMNSLEVAQKLHEDLKKINVMFSTSIHDPNIKELFKYVPKKREPRAP